MVRLVWGDGSQGASHVSIENFQSVNITGVHPAESAEVLATENIFQEELHTLHAEHP